KLDEDEAAAIEAEALVTAVGLRHVQLQLHAAAEPQLRQLTGGPRSQRLPRLVDAGHSLAQPVRMLRQRAVEVRRCDERGCAGVDERAHGRPALFLVTRAVVHSRKHVVVEVDEAGRDRLLCFVRHARLPASPRPDTRSSARRRAANSSWSAGFDARSRVAYSRAKASSRASIAPERTPQTTLPMRL